MKKNFILRSYSAEKYSKESLGYEPRPEDATSLEYNSNSSLISRLSSNFESGFNASAFSNPVGSFVGLIPSYQENPYVSTLLIARSAWSWSPGAPKILTYCYRSYDGPTVDGSTITHYNAALAETIRSCFAAYEKALDIHFVETSDVGSAQMVVQFIPLPAGVLGESSMPSAGTDKTWTGISDGFLNAAPNDPALIATLIHELGHALGLAHSFEGNGFPGTENNPWVPGDFNLSTSLATTMAYSGARRNVTPMALDIAALQYLYGANLTSGAGDDSYEINDYGVYYRCIWDVGGVDQIVYRGNLSVVIDLRAATIDHSELGGGGISYSFSGSTNYFTIAQGVLIENAIGGSGNDIITGNQADNHLYGNAGDDFLNGGNGNDYLDGGEGDDRLFGGEGNHTLDGGSGNDYLYGGDGDDLLNGGSGNDTLDGAAGDDQLDGLEGDDQLNSGTGNDFILGGNGNDTLDGGEGNDQLDGGRGDDQLDGGAGLNIAIYNGRRSDYSITYNANSGKWTIIDAGGVSGRSGARLEGTDTLHNIKYLYFEETNSFYALTSSGLVTKFAPKALIDNDVEADILFRNTNTGEVGVRFMNADGSIKGWQSGGIVDADWTLAGVADFDRDALSDLLWRNTTTGEVAQWIFHNDRSVTQRSLGFVSLDWQIADTGDFNNDGITDILWRQTSTGEAGQWFMDADGMFDGWNSLGVVSKDWKILASDDFNNDGISDILWRSSSSGEVGQWIIGADGKMTEWQSQGAVSFDWSYVDTADFNGDGNADLLWRNSVTGQIGEWIMGTNGTTSWRTQGIVGLSWQVGGTGDYNGDDIVDILWRNSKTGDVGQWIMNQDGTVNMWKTQGVTATDWQITKT